ncbi:MAG: hypothetical protein AYK19_09100 [Theionarchaea archaeon DG-70-1]|nr:MAG: hypothetical protein AYK19_09100 [Theionarchaea archaeon DG-70-1]
MNFRNEHIIQLNPEFYVASSISNAIKTINKIKEHLNRWSQLGVEFEEAGEVEVNPLIPTLEHPFKEIPQKIQIILGRVRGLNIEY